MSPQRDLFQSAAEDDERELHRRLGLLNQHQSKDRLTVIHQWMTVGATLIGAPMLCWLAFTFDNMRFDVANLKGDVASMHGEFSAMNKRFESQGDAIKNIWDRMVAGATSKPVVVQP